jgi:hypothetical protein
VVHLTILLGSYICPDGQLSSVSGQSTVPARLAAAPANTVLGINTARQAVNVGMSVSARPIEKFATRSLFIFWVVAALCTLPWSAFAQI